MNTGSKRICWSAATLLVAGTAVPAMAGGVPAGSLITNTAQATYTGSNGAETVNSNPVTLQVDEVLDVAAISQESGPVSATTNAVLRYKLTNTGNGPEAFTLTANPGVSGNPFNAVVTGLAIDVNGNGVFDAGIDTALTNGATVPAMNAEDALNVLVLVTVPGTAAAGATSRVELTATAVTGTGTPGRLFAGAGLNGGDAVVGASTALQSAQGVLSVDRTTVSLVKSAVLADPFGGTRPVPGALITYRILATVAGTGSVSGLAVTDPIPAGTTYQPGTLRLENAPLSDGADSDAGQASAAGGIAVQLGTLPAGATRAVTFQVKIN